MSLRYGSKRSRNVIRTQIRLGLLASLTAVVAIAQSWAQEKNPDRNAYFGEEHIHTSWSVDAG